MSTGAVIVDLLALAAVAAGFHLVFRQGLLRRLWGAADPPRRTKDGGQDPAHYAMIIFGMMLLAFGIIIFAFTTLFAVMTPG
jgi:hypothetical protein